MNKKAFLLGEFTLKIIIAVLSISILIYLLFTIYNMFAPVSKTDEAEATLDKIIEISNKVNSEGEELGYLLKKPKNWFILYYPNGVPEVCDQKRCLCICDEAGVLSDQLDKCNEAGACKRVSYDVSMEGDSIEIDLTEIIIKKQGEGVSISKNV